MDVFGEGLVRRILDEVAVAEDSSQADDMTLVVFLVKDGAGV